MKRPRQTNFIPLYLMGAGVLLLVASIAWLYWPKAENPVLIDPQAQSEIPYPEIARVSVADTYAASVAGTATIVDVRGEPYYSEGHIPGALSISITELEARLNELNPQDWIITYCT